MIAEHVLDIDHPNDNDRRSDKRRCQQQAEKPGNDPENNLGRQCQCRGQRHDPSLHQRYADVTLDKMNNNVEQDP